MLNMSPDAFLRNLLTTIDNLLARANSRPFSYGEVLRRAGTFQSQPDCMILLDFLCPPFDIVKTDLAYAVYQTETHYARHAIFRPRSPDGKQVFLPAPQYMDVLDPLVTLLGFNEGETDTWVSPNHYYHFAEKLVWPPMLGVRKCK